jgi:hypothetical protein
MAFEVTFDENDRVLSASPLNDESHEELTGEKKAKPPECNPDVDFCD